jgi:uncharacterized metal-binding protein YceD (DUF177 family)
MLVKVVGLTEPTTIEISGGEPWLDRIYTSFGLNPLASEHPIKGNLTISPEHDLGFLVEGRVVFQAPVDCSRCGKDITWPISEDINVFYSANSPDKKDKSENGINNLSSDDLDDYRLEDESINLEILINEFIQLAIPNRKVLVDENDNCQICLMDLSDETVFGQDTSVDLSENPFGKLKGLKFPG